MLNKPFSVSMPPQGSGPLRRLFMFMVPQSLMCHSLYNLPVNLLNVHRIFFLISLLLLYLSAYCLQIELSDSFQSVLPGKSFDCTHDFPGKVWAIAPAIFRITVSPQLSANSAEWAVIFLCTTKAIIIKKLLDPLSRMQKKQVKGIKTQPT